MKLPTTATRAARTTLTAVTVAALLAGATACGGDDSTSSNEVETRELITQLLDAARGGASTDELVDLLIEADPEILEQAIPEIENELDIVLPEIAVPSPDEPDDPTSPQGEDSPSGVAEGDGSIASEPPSSTPPVVTLPGGTPSLPGLATPSLPTTTKAPEVTLPGGGLPSLPRLPAPNLPSTSAPANRTISFDLVQLDDRSDSKFLQVILSVDSVGKPTFVDVNYDSTSGVLTRRLSLDFVQQMDSNTSLWTTSMRSDTDPCSLRFTISPTLLVNSKGITLYKNFMGC